MMVYGEMWGSLWGDGSDPDPLCDSPSEVRIFM